MEIVGEMFSYNSAASGYPHITVPCGKVYELPIGFSFFGTAYSEPELIDWLTLSNKHLITELNLVSRNLL
jgi:Asp-tRNA(Asn)/Glu-tRNA(Gln) amidotransferase A subunit family amidase